MTREVSEMRPALHAVFATVLMCVTTVAYTYHMPDFGRFFQGHNDFVLRYSQARIVGSGHMYDVEADYGEQDQAVGFHIAGSYQVRLPWQAMLWAPLARLPYLTAYWVWIGANLACFALLVPLWLLPRGYVLWGAVYFPVAASIIVGQDALMLALCVAGILVLGNRGHEVGAGLLLALCTAKPHLFLLVPIVLLAQRRWKILLSATAGTLCLLAVSTALEGPDWVSRLIRSMRLMEADSGPIASVRPSVFQLGVNGVTIAIAVLLVTLFCAGIWRVHTLEAGLAVAIASSILIAPHASIYDLPVFLVALLALPLSGKGEWLRIALLTPVPYWALLNGRPWNAVLPVMMLGAIAVSMWPQFTLKSESSFARLG